MQKFHKMRGNAAFELKLFVPLEGEEREESRLGGGRLNLQKHNGNNKPASHIQLCGILLIILQISPRRVLLDLELRKKDWLGV